APLLSVRAAVLAGGAARRYGGRPKGLVALGGRRILDRVVDAVQSVAGESPLLVANAPDASTWRPDLRTVPDVRPGCGSLGGIYTAVVSGSGPVLCVAWDMPFVSPGGGDAHDVDHRAQERRQDDPARGPRGGAGASQVPGYDHQARHPPGWHGPAGQGHLAALARGEGRAGADGGPWRARPVRAHP